MDLMHCKMFSSIPGLYPLDASSTSPAPSVRAKNTSRHCQMPLGAGAKLPYLETAGIDGEEVQGLSLMLSV